MANRKPLSPSQIMKLQEMFGASLRKTKLFSDEAQDLIENHWDELEDELMAGCIIAINCVLERKRNPILRLISGDETLVLDETDGAETISGAKDTFPGGIDRDFVNWGADEASGPTGKTPVAVYELAQDATFAQMFGSVSDDPGRLCLSQSQILGFVKKHRNWLHPDRWAMFSYSSRSGELFVASVAFDDRARLDVDVNLFESDDVWSAELRPRLVLKQ